MKEIKMLYKEYKENYANCDTKADSYNETEKTIVVYVPDGNESIFYHYGVKIEVKFSDDMESDLKKMDIEYTCLPLLEEKVVRFFQRGKRYYAYCVPCGYEEPHERVYLTTEIPEDLSWKNIDDDYHMQREGEAPMALKTRARVLYDKAFQMAADNPFQKPTNFSEWCHLNQKNFEVALLGLGFNLDELKNMEHHDTPELDEL